MALLLAGSQLLDNSGTLGGKGLLLGGKILLKGILLKVKRLLLGGKILFLGGKMLLLGGSGRLGNKGLLLGGGQVGVGGGWYSLLEQGRPLGSGPPWHGPRQAQDPSNLGLLSEGRG